MIFPVVTLTLALLAAQAPEAPKPAPEAPKAAVKPKVSKPKAKAKPVRKFRKADYSKQMDLNSATKAQLKTLPGITDALADKIIAARPYYSKAKLNDGVLPQGAYGALKDKVKAVPPPLPKK